MFVFRRWGQYKSQGVQKLISRFTGTEVYKGRRKEAGRPFGCKKIHIGSANTGGEGDQNLGAIEEEKVPSGIRRGGKGQGSGVKPRQCAQEAYQKTRMKHS